MRATLALFSRSLRVDTRLMRTYVFRAAVVVILLLNLWAMQSTSSTLGAPGLRFFQVLVWLNTFFLSLLCIALFSSAISEEKEDRTLPLLRMTRLSPVSILLGKATSRLVTVVLFVLVQFPFTLLALTLGGVSATQVYAAYAMLLAHVVFVANLALFCSVLCSATWRAGAMTFILLLIYLLIPAFFAAIADGLAEAKIAVPLLLVEIQTWTRTASPFYRTMEISRTGFPGPVVGVHVWTCLGLGTFFFLLSWVGFDALTRRVKSVTGRGLVWRGASTKRGGGAGRAWINPLVWKDFHFIVGGVWWLFLKFALYALFFILFPILVGVNDSEVGGVIMGFALLFLVLELGFTAGRVFQREMRGGTLSVIMLLPMPLYEISYNKVIGCLFGVIPVVTWFFIGFALDPESVKETMTEGNGLLLVYYMVSLALVFIHLSALISLYIRGAMLWSAMITIFTNVLFFMMVAILDSILRFVDEEVWIFMFSSFMCVVAVAIHCAIGWRLRVVATK